MRPAAGKLRGRQSDEREPAPHLHLQAHLLAVRGVADRQTLWLLWPKKASGVRTDVSEPVVRQTGLAHGLVDYKICAVDATWSGLKFSRRKS